MYVHIKIRSVIQAYIKRYMYITSSTNIHVHVCVTEKSIKMHAQENVYVNGQKDAIMIDMKHFYG